MGWSKNITMYSRKKYNKKLLFKTIRQLNQQFPSSFFSNIVLKKTNHRYLSIFERGKNTNAFFLIISCDITAKCFNNYHREYSGKEKHNNNRIDYRKPMDLNVCHGQICIPTKKTYINSSKIQINSV